MGPAPAIALYNPSLSPAKARSAPSAPPQSPTALPMNSFNFSSSIAMAYSLEALLKKFSEAGSGLFAYRTKFF
jgi:hypothetical protein